MDFRKILYLHPAYAEFFPANEAEVIFPDIFIHADMDKRRLNGILKEGVLYEDGRLKILIDTWKKLPTFKVPRHLRGQFGNGRIYYFQLNVSYSVCHLPEEPEWEYQNVRALPPHGYRCLRRRHDDGQVLEHFHFDAVTEEFHTSYKAHMIYACVESSAFLKRMLKSNVRLSHAIDAGGDVKRAYGYLPDVNEYLPWAGCSTLITEGRITPPPFARIIKSNWESIWVKMKSWNKCDFLEHLINGNANVFWDMRTFTNREIQYLAYHYNRNSNFRTILLRLMQTNMFHSEFSRLLDYMNPEQRVEAVNNLTEEATFPFSSHHLISLMPYFSLEQKQRILHRRGGNSKGVLDLREVVNCQIAEDDFEKLLDCPYNVEFIKYFDANSVSWNLYERIRIRIKKMGLRKRLALMERKGREWYEVI